MIPRIVEPPSEANEVAPAKMLLRLDAVHKRYGAFEALNDVNMSVAYGEVVAIIGPSGSGKSTLLRCINQLEPPTSGRVVLADASLEAGREASRSELMLLRRSVGMVFQSFNLFPHMTVLRNVSLAQQRVMGRSRVIVMADGRIIEQGPSARVMRNPICDRAKAFLNAVKDR